jgi:hypothetical protein
VVAAARHTRAHHHAEAHHKVTVRQPQVADAAPAAKEPAIPLAKWNAGAPAKQPDAQAASASGTGNASVQEQVAVATALAERITALSALPAPHGKTEAAAHSESVAAPASSRLVAVLMVRPNVRAISELRGRIIAIDERYAAASSKVTAAMSAAGASDVQLMQGQGTAINRLTNGEVPAAVVALVAPEAAEAFPEIAGYKIIRVPL